MAQLAVTGAGGKTGGAIVAAASPTWAVRALARNDEQAEALRTRGCEVVVGDIADRATLAELVEGVDAAYHICPNFHPDEVAIGAAVIGAAAGVDRLVYHSVLHPQTEAMPHHWRKLRVEELLLVHRPGRSTFLRSAPYVQNLVPYVASALRDGELRIPYSVDTATAMVDLVDVGRAAVAALGPDVEPGSGWDLCGVGAVTHREIAEGLRGLAGTAVEAVTVAPPDGTHAGDPVDVRLHGGPRPARVDRAAPGPDRRADPARRLPAPSGRRGPGGRGVKPVTFDYHRPATVAEAVELLGRLDDAKVLAGGQSLVPLMNFRMAAPAHLVDISRLGELSTIEVSAEAVTVGAAVTHSALLADAPAIEALPLLRQAEELVAHEVIRNRGTVCGSLAHADPSGELTAVLALLEGSVEAVSAGGRRTVPAAELFVGPLMSSLAEDELLVSARFPRLPATASTAFQEVARRHGDYAVCGVAVAVDRPSVGGEGDGAPVGSARAAFLSVGPVPVLIDLDPVVAGRRPAEIDRGELYDHVAGRVEPSSDIHATAAYRRHLAGVLVGEALAEALGEGS